MITLLNKFDDQYKIKEKDILDIAWSIIKENKLEEYLTDIRFNPDSPHIGDYSEKKKIITLNDQRIYTTVNELYKRLLIKHQIDDIYYTYFWNFYYLFIIFHEVEHVNQRAIYESGDGNKLSDLLYEKSISIKNKDNNLYKENHDLFPVEIEANNIGYLNAYKLMSHTKLPKREQRIMHLEYLKALLHNYQKTNKRIITPMDKFSMLTSEININEINELLNNTRLSKIERMNHGLDINPSEYDSILKLRVSESLKVLKKCK